ncbi:hypothetical protein HUZ36_00980 [Pseudoalteromonas sp. McH1-7]|uniref:S41 family peptidase n=1 Tax=Pseudoalteromonas sp. McH1-7 TaxID=2745574 RepID=UPI001591E954|nr:S41 family peptidase [Pseudoalteromonas sp. McH1-7]NUZ09342.1 hypothetical protein [Pseudoalteromonas sp. McH1-7]
MFKLSTVASVLALSFTSGAIAQISYLEDTRNQISVQDYSYEQKALVAEQAKLLLDGLYVNKYAKNLYYGLSPAGHLDPVVAIDELINNMGNLSSTQFHQQLQQIFLSQRDFHLDYNYPAPMKNFISFVPVHFAQTVSAEGSKEVRVNRIWQNYTVLAPEIASVSLGDKVVAYNGQPIIEAVNNNLFKGGGANPDGGFVGAVNTLTIKSHNKHFPPQQDALTITLESYETGETYSINVPWLVFNSKPNAPATAQDETAQFTQSINYEFATFKELEAAAQDDTFMLAANGTAEPTVTWNKVQVDGESVGYIKLASFSPTNGVNTALVAIIDLLDNKLNDTKALIIDVRGNPGGNIVYNDYLLQLFTPKRVTPSHVRFINTDENHHILNNSQFGTFLSDNWRQVLADVKGTTEQYSAATSFITKDAANQIGQAYYGNVGIWANANTYSAGDMFTCGMQDNGIATVFGQHERTGAGGANVLEHNVFVQYVGAPYQALPYEQSMRVSWRQSVRQGHHINALIEDYGCVADELVSYNVEDIFDGDTQDFNTIARKLLAKPTAQATVVFESDRFAPIAQTNGLYSFDVTNTEYVDVYIDGTKVKRIPAFAYGAQAKTLSYTLPADVTSGTVQFVGLDSGKTRLWNSTRFF